MQHVGVRIIMHQQPNGKLHSLKLMIETCHQIIISLLLIEPVHEISNNLTF